MITTVLVPVDGSPLAERALPYASAIARALEARVLVLNVTCSVARMMEHEVDLREIVESLRAEGLAAEALVREKACDDDVGRAIGAAARESQADLLVMSTHGRSGLDRFAYGSVAERVLRHATVPVLLVPALSSRCWPNDRLRRILVCLDGSELAEAALGPAGDLAARCRTKLVLARVVEPPLAYLGSRAVDLFGYEVIAEQSRTSQYLDAMADALRKSGHAVTTRSSVGAAAEGIMTVATHEDVDLIAMATHGRGGMTRLLMGSVTAKIVERATRPVMIVRP